VDFLDRLCLEIRTKTKAKMKPTEFIRALVAGLIGSGMDLSAFRTEEDIAAAIKEQLKGRRQAAEKRLAVFMDL
jgi:hypothetical protein